MRRKPGQGNWCLFCYIFSLLHFPLCWLLPKSCFRFYLVSISLSISQVSFCYARWKSQKPMIIVFSPSQLLHILRLSQAPLSAILWRLVFWVISLEFRSTKTLRYSEKYNLLKPIHSALRLFLVRLFCHRVGIQRLLAGLRKFACFKLCLDLW